MKFARLFDFTTGQLLVFITGDLDTKGYLLSIQTCQNGEFIKSGLSFPKFSEASDAMDGLTDQEAVILYNSLIDITNPSLPTPRSPLSPPSPVSGSIEGLEDWINKFKN